MLSGGQSWPCWHLRPSLYFRTASSCHFLSNVQSDNNISSIIWCWYWCGRFGLGSTVTHSSTSCICLCVQTKTAIVKSLTSNSATNTDPLMCSYTYCIDGVCVCAFVWVCKWKWEKSLSEEMNAICFVIIFRESWPFTTLAAPCQLMMQEKPWIAEDNESSWMSLCIALSQQQPQSADETRVSCRRRGWHR